MVLEDFTIFWTNEADPAAKRQFLSLIFESVWLDQDRVVAVQPKPSFLPFFEHRRPPQAGGKAGVKYGSDGTRTRDLCRDRANERPATSGNIRHLQGKRADDPTPNHAAGGSDVCQRCVDADAAAARLPAVSPAYDGSNRPARAPLAGEAAESRPGGLLALRAPVARPHARVAAHDTLKSDKLV